ncbi:hypothetical protein ANTHELSMS3_00844 [Antarctobacter heliothermus]|uniref:Uncharacterized protein n=1 Tax=Antarctobacter heliothermus TaxID=74033 RepID=A0A222E0S6_9RHOB|nr:hypothetical protein [Antarctobacter heliothermus]ASP19561.1 hypothetical protein ANTHELSMS3_00844 [Antarctobacter heliothermus]
MTGLLAPNSGPSQNDLAAWREDARHGEGSPWLKAAQADALARYALKYGEGVHMMEAIAPRFREPPRDVSWEILGDDPEGDNWDDHQNPQQAYRLFQKKLHWAQRDGAVLHYKIWLKKAGH